MPGPSAQLQRYANGLASGLLTVPEVASAVLDVLADAADRAALWASAPAGLWGRVMAHLAEVGGAGVPPAFWIGPGEPDPARRAVHTARRRAVAAELLAAAEPSVAPDPRRPDGSGG
jgi:hypothetical protein